MVSIAIALVLILGVNQVFKIGAQTVGAGQAFSEITRDERTAHIEVYTDVHNAVTTNQPALLITSQRTYAFRDQQDAVSEPSGQPGTITINNVAQSVSDVLMNSRNYRFDTLGFFGSGDLYQRQTADAGSFVSSLTSSSAWIWYGHLTLPNNAQINGKTTGNDWFDPGSTTGLSGTAGANNDNNRYAAEWILGRVAMVLFSGNTLTLATPNANYYTSTTATINPLAYNTAAQDGSLLYSSRYDLVAATMSSFNVFTSGITNGVITAYANTNRSCMMLRPTGTAPYNIFRFQGNPYPVKPLTAINMAAVAPIFLQHCSQFIVEYAGDYLTQDNNPYVNIGGTLTANPNYGAVGSYENTSGTVVPSNGAQGDGVVDFTVDKSADPNWQTPATANPALWVRKIRWYGFPRDANGDGVIDIVHDVVPLRDVLQAPAPNGAAQQPPTAATAMAPWEAFNNLTIPTSGNYADGTTNPNAQYLCSWGSETVYPLASGTSNGLPRMLRITLALDDPNGRLAGPQIYEYVIDLGAQQ
jgi:hypothetical protein